MQLSHGIMSYPSLHSLSLSLSLPLVFLLAGPLNCSLYSFCKDLPFVLYTYRS
uniref:Uncharacterized protein n=1 Tax=Rhizophora mucronata TaxID=61149 RepID=A0A2P2P034_RHIMU